MFSVVLLWWLCLLWLSLCYCWLSLGFGWAYSWLLIVCELCGWVYVALFDSVVVVGCCVVVGFLVCVVLLVL